MGFVEPCFADSDEALAAGLHPRTPSTSRLLRERGFATLPLPDAPFADGGFPTPSGKVQFFSARLPGRPDFVPNHECAQTTPGWRHATRWP
jgi:hypothetical protein